MASFHVYAGAEGAPETIPVRNIEIGDLYDCLRAGVDDFMANPSHVIFIVIMYPLIGVVLATWTSGANAWPLLFPLMAGFALLGPLAALGLYEISRQREQGRQPTLRSGLDVRQSPALPSIAVVGIYLMAVFITWLLVAQALYTALMGPEAPESMAAFFAEIFATSEGWMLIVLGNLIGLCFAVLVLATTVIAFPLLLDRDVGAYAAMATSVRAAARNPVQMVVWGLIVAVLLALGSIPLFAGLIVVLPVLGHATWHLYRKLVA